MKTRRRKRQPVTEEPTAVTPPTTIFSSDLLTPEEERELLADFWETKSELVRVLIRHFPGCGSTARPLEPWPMAQFIRDHCDDDARNVAAVRRSARSLHPFKHRLASANIRLAAHVAKRFRHHALSYADLLQEAVCGLMQAIDRFDVSHGTRLATYATWWIRQTLQIAVARQSHLVSLSPHHLQELGLLQQESEALAHGGKHLPSPQELASRTGSSLEHLTHLQTATRTPVSLNAVLDDDSDFKLTEAMPDNESTHAAAELRTPGSPQLPDGKPPAARTQGPRSALRPDRQRHPQPPPDRPSAPHQQGTRPPDPEPGPGKAPGLRRTRRLGAELAVRLS